MARGAGSPRDPGRRRGRGGERGRVRARELQGPVPLDTPAAPRPRRPRARGRGRGRSQGDHLHDARARRRRGRSPRRDHGAETSRRDRDLHRGAGRAEPIRRGRGDRVDLAGLRASRQTEGRSPSAVPERDRPPAHAGAERRDPRSRGARRPLRCFVVSICGHAAVARDGAPDIERRGGDAGRGRGGVR